MVVKKIFLVCCVLLAVALPAQLPVIGADSLVKHYRGKMNRYIGRDTALADFYSIDIYGISVYAGKKEKELQQPEYRVTWQELPVYKNLVRTAPRDEAMQILKSKGRGPFPPEVQRRYGLVRDDAHAPGALPLSGYRFAIDPGHFASDSLTAHLEDKLIDMYLPAGRDSERVTFYESTLTWETAVLLAEKLRAQGAVVLLTRKAYGLTSFGKTFAQWKAEDYPRTLDSLLKLNPADPNLRKLKSGRLKDNKSIFRYVFRDVELRKRAELINAFHPDLTVVIHYNVDEQNKPWERPTGKDFCMTFVGGAFQEGELDDPERRYDFLRLLLLDDIENSIYASGLAASEFQSELEVPLAKTTDAVYLKKNCLPAGQPGVYCRNLSLTRLVQGTIIYGETLYQDNREEMLRLQKDSRAAHPGDRAEQHLVMPEDSRVAEVAEAYYRAILLWKESR